MGLISSCCRSNDTSEYKEPLVSNEKSAEYKVASVEQKVQPQPEKKKTQFADVVSHPSRSFFLCHALTVFFLIMPGRVGGCFLLLLVCVVVYVVPQCLCGMMCSMRGMCGMHILWVLCGRVQWRHTKQGYSKMSRGRQ